MPADGSDFGLDDVCGFQDMNEIKNSYAGATAPSAPANGLLRWDSVNKIMYRRHSSAWAVVNNYRGRARDGMVFGWTGGYFGDGSNGSYTRVLGSANTVAGANAYLNPLGFYVADGSVPNQASSAIWSASGRYLPNLTDDRFIMGDTTAGSIGGESANSHTHPIDPPSATTSTSVYGEEKYCGTDTVGPDGHNHTLNIGSFASGIPSDTENRPVFLGLFLIVKVY